MPLIGCRGDVFDGDHGLRRNSVFDCHSRLVKASGTRNLDRRFFDHASRIFDRGLGVEEIVCNVFDLPHTHDSTLLQLSLHCTVLADVHSAGEDRHHTPAAHVRLDHSHHNLAEEVSTLHHIHDDPASLDVDHTHRLNTRAAEVVESSLGRIAGQSSQEADAEVRILVEWDDRRGDRRNGAEAQARCCNQPPADLPARSQAEVDSKADLAARGGRRWGRRSRDLT